MLTRLVLLSVVAVHFVCESVSSVESNWRSIISSGSPSSSADLLAGTHSVRTRASSASSAKTTTTGQRSPLVEIMLRILDTIQVVPKKRPRRAVSVVGQKRHSKVAARLTSPGQSELDKAPLFSGSGISNTNNNKPLLESSLEQTIVDAEQHLSEEDSQQIIVYDQSQQVDSYSTEQDIPNYPTADDSYEVVREETDEKIYDLLLKILQILDDQAHRDAERARRLGTQRILDDHISNEHPTEGDDDDDDSEGDLDDEIESD